MVSNQFLVTVTGSAIAFTTFFASSVQAAGLDFSNVYVFGDSLSDTGNLFNISGQTFPPPPYFNGRFSNGPNWIDYLSEDLGVTPTTFISEQGTPISPLDVSSQSVNFAVGGATTGVDNTVDPNLSGLQQQVQAFSGSLLATNQTADPNALYIIWAGGNDYLPTTSAFTPYTTPTPSINNLSLAIASLLQEGAKEIAVANLPSLGSVPLTIGTPDAERLDRLSQAHNLALEQTLENFSENSDARITSLDFASLFDTITENPGEFGLTNVTSNCLLTGCLTPDEFLFWDDIHPTTKVHQLLADEAYSSLEANNTTVPEPASGLGLLTIGILGTASLLKRK